jgi:hypothetical protein
VGASAWWWAMHGVEVLQGEQTQARRGGAELALRGAWAGLEWADAEVEWGGGIDLPGRGRL